MPTARSVVREANLFRLEGAGYHPAAARDEREDSPDLSPQTATLYPRVSPRAPQVAIRILIVDDHKLFAQALGAALDRKGMEVVGIASSRAEAVDMAQRLWPDITLVDIALRAHDGLSVAKDLMRESPGRRVIALTAAEHEASQREAMAAGLHGFLLKDASLELLLASIGTVHEGQDVFPLQPAGAMQGSRTRGHAYVLVGLLTGREREILGLLADALPTPRIAEHLNLSISTVRTHVQTILGKLEVHSRLEAVAFARLNGILEAD